MFLIIFQSGWCQAAGLAKKCHCEFYTEDAVIAGKPSHVADIAIELCKAGISFEVLPWD